MSDVFFSGDHHFWHSNIILYCKRPWLQEGDIDERGRWVSEEIKKQRGIEMTEDLIANWNSVVKPEDTVYHVGDFVLSKDRIAIERLIKRLNGKIHLVLGNHDKSAVQKARGFESITGKHQGSMIRVYKQDIFLSHYAMRVWDRSHFGIWNLFGHSHGKLPEFDNVLAFDVGVDAWNYYPVSFGQVKAKMDTKTFIPINKRSRK